ncbi:MULTISPECIES: DUF3159 domain-containing protein [unclassified Mycobacterium]|uniref:DUF3159 domain-containing protein n=1 Tax=unclassified Mycobacterium TaxID=2642494 RepID=UPI000992CBE9|nr:MULTISPECIES: DUF3159 domain-containing protein [unclassified Mycobacterium]
MPETSSHEPDGSGGAHVGSDTAEGPQLKFSVPGTKPEEPGSSPLHEMWHQAGGWQGIVYSSIPVIVFVVAVSISSLMPAIVAALVAATLVLVWRLVRRESLQPAVSGFISVGISALIAYLLGEAKGYFLIGIWANFFWGTVFLVSVIIRRPIVGYAYSWATGGDMSWRGDRRIRTAFDIATVAWIALFATRFVVQQWLYVAGNTAWLGGTKIAMGWPLTAVGALVTLLVIRYVRRHTDNAAEESPASS